MWIKPLEERGLFKRPPSTVKLPDGYQQFPQWPELSYLCNVAEEAPCSVIRIITTLPKTDNPVVYGYILTIALNLKPSQSVELLPKLLEHVDLSVRFSSHHFGDLINHWVDGGECDDALKLALPLISFQQDPRKSEKEKNKDDEGIGAIYSHLEPTTKFDQWEYEELLKKGIQPLAKKAPFSTAKLLTRTVTDLIFLSKNDEEIKQGKTQDYSEIWCRNLELSEGTALYAKERAVQTLVFTCKQVYENDQGSIQNLDSLLRKQKWTVFKRIRHYLYGLYPSAADIDWIRDEILLHKEYGRYDLNYEFQFMIRNACQALGNKLLSKSKLNSIIEAILEGPPREQVKEWMGEYFTEENYEARRLSFQRNQLWTFEPILDEKHIGILESIKGKLGTPDPEPLAEPSSRIRGGFVSEVSPKSTDELSNFNDQELLDFLNSWDDVHHDRADFHKEFNHNGLMHAFKGVCEEVILKSSERFEFWHEHLDEIKLPLYVASIIQAMQNLAKERGLGNVEQWLEFCNGVLAHHDNVEGTDEFQGAANWKRPSWSYPRRAVGDFMEHLLKKEVDLPFTLRFPVFQVLKQLCQQGDYYLDNDHEVFNDALGTAINQTRGRALESLIEYGYWVRKHEENDSLTEVFSILESRLTQSPMLSLPEHALLAVHIHRIYGLDKEWMKAHVDEIIPMENINVWKHAFATVLRYGRNFSDTYSIFKSHYQFALQHLKELHEIDDRSRDVVDTLGQHLFLYYLWECFDLTGKKSLLEDFYKNTSEDRERWSNLFSYVGHTLEDSGPKISESILERIKAFFEWRMKVGYADELREFTFWLKAECLSPQWRLEKYKQILKFGTPKRYGVSFEVKTLNELLEKYPNDVLECFEMITSSLEATRNTYFKEDEVKPILKVGLSSNNETTREHAQRAQEKLLRLGHFEYLKI